MSATAVSAGKFFAVWTPVALAAMAIDPTPRLADLFMITIGGVAVPPVTCVLGALGIAAARPLARKGEQQLSLTLFLLVSAIMLILVELWIVEHRPSALYTFVVAIGLGFSGYSLIELVGHEIQAAIASRIRTLAGGASSPVEAKSSDPEDTDHA